MFGLTSLGVVHTLISIVALVAGAIALVRDREITPTNRLGQVFIWTTVLTCLTGFGIFQHGGFGPPHALGIVTLLVLAVAAVAARTQVFGKLAVYVVTVSYSLTYFLHWIPGVTETFSRLPAGAPLFTGPEDPGLQPVIGTLFVIFLIGATLQVRRIRAQRKPTAAAA